MIPSAKSTVLYENCCCNQDEFDIAVFEKTDKLTNKVVTISCSDFKLSVERSLIPLRTKLDKTVLIGSEVYIFDRDIKKEVYTDTFKTFSKTTNVCKELKFMESHLKYFSVCSFMSSVYVIGDYLDSYRWLSFYSNKCYKHDKLNKTWCEIANLNVKKCDTACSVFEGKIVVTGGSSYSAYLESVEAFDHQRNKWTVLADMIKRRVNHSSVTIGNKLFVIGGNEKKNSEVYDIVSRKFTTFSFRLPCKSCKIVSFNNKMAVFCGCFSNRY